MTVEVSGLSNEITVSGEGNEITITRVGAQGPSGTGNLGLGDLTDVTLSLVQQKQFVQYVGSIWRNVSLAATDIPSLDASKTTSGTFTDARIAQSNVTQHQAALAIAASQLTSGSLSISLTPDTDQAYNLGTEDFRWGTLHGDVEGSVVFRAKNANAGALAVGDVVYISGYTSGETPDVDLADANDSAKMPAFGIVSIGGNSGAEVHVVTFGTLIGLDLNPATYSAGDAIYVSNTAGDFTNTPPTGESSGLQKIGVVIKPNTGGGTNGSMKVLGAGRTNAVPNLNSGNIFYGNGSNQAVPTALTSVAEAAGAVSTHAAVTSGVHGISAFGSSLVDDADAATARTTLGLGTAATSATGDFLASSAASAFGLTLIDDVDAAAARTTLGLGTAATSATGDFEASGSVSTHAAVTSGVHGISTFGATLIDDADAATARTTLGAAATNHNHSASQITSGTFDDARIASSNVTQHAGDINIGNLGNVTTGLLSDNMFLAYSTGATAFTGRAPAAARTALGFSSFGSSLIDDADAAAARVTLDYAVNSPSMTGVSAGSITGIIKCSQAQYDAITPDAATLYVIV